MSNSDKVKIKVVVDTGFVGGEHVGYLEVDRVDWDSMSSKEKELFLEGEAEEFMHNYISYYAEVVEEED